MTPKKAAGGEQLVLLFPRQFLQQAAGGFTPFIAIAHREEGYTAARDSAKTFISFY